MTILVDDKRDSSLFKIPLDAATLHKMRACKNAGFPLCLEKSFVSLFNDSDKVVKTAVKAGYVAPNVEEEHDIWDIYLKLLSTLSKEIGNDVVAAIEFRTLKEIESLECTECPIYDMEMKMNRSRFMEKHS